MTIANDTRAAAVAQRIRKGILAWPDVRDFYGPQLGQRDQFFMRFVFEDGTSFALELTKDTDE